MRRLTYALLYFGGWTLVGVFFATQTYMGGWYSESPLTWKQAFVIALTAWYARALFAPVIFWLARRFPVSKDKWFKSILIHAAGSLVIAVIEQIAYDIVILRFHSIPRRVITPVDLHMNLATYWVLVGAAHFLGYYRRYRERELAASRLEAELAAAKLDLLRGQLHPHFLFNTLNGISELIHEDADQADLMLGHLSDMLRFSLEQDGKREVTLGEELEFTKRYLELQRMRFQERLSFHVDASPGLLACRVPYLILQPLVENAILHGIARSPGAGQVDVKACKRNGSLRIEVRDTGPGLSPGAMTEGVGLRNTRLRLLHSYGASGRLDLASMPKGGTCAAVELPLRDDSREDAVLLKAE